LLLHGCVELTAVRATEATLPRDDRFCVAASAAFTFFDSDFSRDVEMMSRRVKVVSFMKCQQGLCQESEVRERKTVAFESRETRPKRGCFWHTLPLPFASSSQDGIADAVEEVEEGMLALPTASPSNIDPFFSVVKS
jgi:hypothetical protein